MNRLLLILLAGAWAVALAQAPPEENPEPGAEAGESRPGAQEEEIPDVPVSELTEAEKAAKAMADEDFKPGDEISEDYPVPLPSDI